MFKHVMLLSAFAAGSAFAADSLTVSPKNDLARGVPVEITLKLDQPADSAELSFSSYKRPFFLNGASTLKLTPGADRRVFTAKITPETFFHPVYTARRENGAGAVEVTPKVTRGGKVEALEVVKPWVGSLKFVGLQKANQVPNGYGKFGKAACFDGKNAMAALNQVPFDQDKGTVEAWVFLPLMLNKKSGIIWFAQSADGSPWRYHQLSIPANTRKVEYMTYNGQPKDAVSRIVSQEITGEDWLHVAATHDLKNGKIELFVNGKSQGTAPYKVPCGGKFVDVNMGSRIHNAQNTFHFIEPAQIMIDDFRISNSVRVPGAPAKTLTPDENTLVLLSFDGDAYFKK